MPRTFANWSREHHCTPTAWHSPKTEDEVVQIVRDAAERGQTVKVAGSGHSFSALAMTSGVLLNLDALDRVIAIDGQRGIIRVQAGKRLRALCDFLAAEGYTLPIVGSIDVQSLAGLVATGTHGSSLAHGNLSSLVVGMRMVTGTGELLTLVEGDPRLPGARVALGALGVVTELTLRIERMFTLAEHFQPMRFAHAVEHFAANIRTHEYAKFWWIPHTDLAQFIHAERSSEKHNFSEGQRWIDERIVNAWVFPLLLWAGNCVPAFIPAINALIGRAYFGKKRVIGTPHRVLTLAMPPRHSESEWAIPVDAFAPAIVRIRDLANGLRVNFILEARLVKADENWMSPAFGRDTVQIGTYITNPTDRDAFFAGAAGIFADYGGRPHWGKANEMDAERARTLYPHFDDFAALVKTLDARGTFRNGVLDRLLGALPGDTRAPSRNDA